MSHYLVHEGKARVGKKRLQTLRIDTMDRGASRWKGADIIVFNTAHWWSHYKTKSGLVFPCQHFNWFSMPLIFYLVFCVMFFGLSNTHSVLSGFAKKPVLNCYVFK